MTRTWLQVRQQLTRDLARSPAARPEQEAIWITESCSGFQGLEWLEIANQAPSQRAYDQVMEIARRRVVGEPLQYLLGSWQFRELDLLVTPAVLIPRPETELLVEAILEVIPPDRSESHMWSEPEWSAVDLGTGSGAIALALANAWPRARVIGVDRSADALAVARANAVGIGSAARHLSFVEGDWFTGVPNELRGTLHLVVSNPPYLSEQEWEGLPEEVASYEPRSALIAGITGMEHLEIIITEASEWLAPGGWIALEHGETQQQQVVEVLERGGAYHQVRLGNDLNGRPRFVMAQRASK